MGSSKSIMLFCESISIAMFLLRRRHRSGLNPPEGRFERFRVKRKRSFMLKIKQLFHAKTGFFILGLVLFMSFVYLIFFSPIFKIEDISVLSTAQDIPKEKLREALLKKLVQENLLFVELRDELKPVQKSFPEVSTLSCARLFRTRSLECEATSFPLMAVIKHEGKKYYINENGVVIAYDGRKLGLPTFDLVLFVIPSLRSATADSGQTDPPVSFRPTLSESASRRGAEESLSSHNEIFSVVVGKKILETEEIQKILKTLQEFEKILKWKVMEAQYVQVAGELSLTSRPTTNEPNAPNEPNNLLTVLFDLRRNLDEQLEKLLKTKEVIDISKVTRIDLSIDGEKVFYR